jgi:hypothetical protein
MDKTASVARQVALGQLKNQRDQIAVQRGAAAADAWYKKATLAFARQQHQDELAKQVRDEAYRQMAFETSATGTFNGAPTWDRQAQTASLTGMLDGSPTWQRITQEAQLTGSYNGSPTWQKIQEEARLTGSYQGSPTWQRIMDEAGMTGMLNGMPTMQRQSLEAQLTGMFNGNPTLARQQFETGATGYLNGSPTMARQFGEAGLSGYLNGAPTLQREQAGADVNLRAAGLGASLGGPRNWGKYIVGAGAVGQNPLLSTTPNLGAAADQSQQRRLTLADVMGDYGGQGGAIGQAGGAGQPAAQYGAAGQAGGAAGTASGPLTLSSVLGNTVNAVSRTPSNDELGMTDQEATTLRGYYRNPGSAAPVGWWESQSPDMKEYHRGLMSLWGESPDTFENKYRNRGPRQQSVFAAA